MENSKEELFEFWYDKLRTRQVEPAKVAELTASIAIEELKRDNKQNNEEAKKV